MEKSTNLDVSKKTQSLPIVITPELLHKDTYVQTLQMGGGRVDALPCAGHTERDREPRGLPTTHGAAGGPSAGPLSRKW